MKTKQEIQVQCDEDGQTYVCFGTMDKRRAYFEMRQFMGVECGLDKDELPNLEDIYLNPLWYGESREDKNENWYYWANPPEGAEYLGSCWRFDFN
jgi:hypothetical protein